MKIVIGGRLIMYRSGFTNSGRDGHVCIGIIMSINEGEQSVGISQYGYDVKEEDYLINAFTWGSYTFDELSAIYKAQSFLKKQFPNVDLKKNPIDFYQSEKNIAPYKK